MPRSTAVMSGQPPHVVPIGKASFRSFHLSETTQDILSLINSLHRKQRWMGRDKQNTVGFCAAEGVPQT